MRAVPNVRAFQPLAAAKWPAAREFRAAVKRRDWPAGRAVLDAATPAERTRLLWVGGQGRGLEDWLRGLIRDHPEDSAPYAMLGHHLTFLGWKIRGDLERVSARRRQGFGRRLQQAEQVLLEGAARHPGDPAVWTMLLTSGRGLDVGLDEAWRRYHRLSTIDPQQPLAHTEHLQQLMPKWGGDWYQVHKFAFGVWESAAPGSPTPALVAEAHLEHALEMPTRAATKAHMRAALPEIRAAAGHSVWHPRFEPGGIDAELALGMFATTFFWFGDRAAAVRCYRRMGRLAVSWPWGPVRSLVPTNLWLLSAVAPFQRG